MEGLPLHPAIAHVPLGIAMVMPWLLGLALALLRRGNDVRALLLGIVVGQALGFGGAFAATRSGDDEEHRVEHVVPHDAIEEHEEAAQAFMIGMGVVTALALGALQTTGRRQTVLLSLALVGSLMMAAASIRVGHLGGRIVWIHGATDAPLDAPPDPR